MKPATRLLVVLPWLLAGLLSFKKNKETGVWKEKQLYPPQVLAQRLNTNDTANLLILNAGPVDNVKGALTFGAVETPRNLEKLSAFLQTVSRDKEIIIYCGCCPLSVCPNLQPAYDALHRMGFKNYKILRLVHELQEDWIDKGYPM
ncbi:MAG: rhodanese-like domain-containing protein [Edaphocola sp.]